MSEFESESDESKKTHDNVFDAAEHNNENVVKYLVEEKGHSVHALDYSRRTPAHVAAMYGNLNIVKYFLQKDPSLLTTPDSQDDTIFIKSVTYGYLDIVQYLIEEYKIDISQKFSRRHFGNTAVHLAAKYGHLDILKYFIEKENGDVNVENDLRETPIFLAVEYRRDQCFKYLTEEKDADLSKVDSAGNTILYKTIVYDDLDLMKYFLDTRKMRIDINRKNFAGDTLLHQAADLNRIVLTKFLVRDKHADVNIVDEGGKTPLHKAAHKNHYAVCKYLVTNGANIELKDDNGKLAVEEATDRRLINYFRDAMPKRYRRSVMEPITSKAQPIPCKWISELRGAIEGRLEGAPSTHGTSSLQLQSFFILAKAIIRNSKHSGYQTTDHLSLLSPVEYVQNNIDPLAIDAIRSVSQFEQAK